MQRRGKGDPPLATVEEGIRLSSSRLWRLQRAFFASTDPTQWSRSRVPSYITSNAFIARACARVVAAFLEDVSASRLGAFDPAKPVPILELGAGSGRFAHGLLRELSAMRGAAARARVRPLYVVTDLASSSVATLRAHPAFERFRKQGLVDFAVFDAEHDREVTLSDGSRLREDTEANPLVAIANYFFDGVPADVFEAKDGAWWESHLRLSCPAGLDPDDPRTLGEFRTAFERGPRAERPYGGEGPEGKHLDRILARLGADVGEGHVLFPKAGLGLVHRLRRMGGGRLLLLAADRGHVRASSLQGLDPPRLERHGSFSLDVNFHAFALDAQATGGMAMLPSHHPSHLATTAFLWGADDAAATRTHEAFLADLDAGGPEDFFVLKETLERHKDRLDVERALAWIRASAFDPEVFHLAAPRLLAGLAEAHPSVRADALDAARRADEAYYPIGEPRDVPYALGEVFDALDALPEAERAFRASLALYGPSPDIHHRLAGVAFAMGRPEDALSQLDRALSMDPAHDAASAMREAVLTELGRQHQR